MIFELFEVPYQELFEVTSGLLYAIVPSGATVALRVLSSIDL